MKKCIPVLVLTKDDLRPEDVKTIPLSNIKMQSFYASLEEILRAHLILAQESENVYKVHKDATGLFPQGSVLRLEVP
jgi:hypothetical protein